MKSGSCPVFAREGDQVPEGNRELLKLGAAPFFEKDLPNIENLADWLRQNPRKAAAEQDLFSLG